MSKRKNVTIPKQLPDCCLIRELILKANVRQDIEFDFAGHLIAFKDRVTPEIKYINTLFPEYTPHDEQYHTRNMFHLADRKEMDLNSID